MAAAISLASGTDTQPVPHDQAHVQTGRHMSSVVNTRDYQGYFEYSMYGLTVCWRPIGPKTQN